MSVSLATPAKSKSTSRNPCRKHLSHLRPAVGSVRLNSIALTIQRNRPTTSTEVWHYGKPPQNFSNIDDYVVNTFPINFTDDPFGASSGQTRSGLAGGSVDHFAKLRRGHLLKPNLSLYRHVRVST